MTLVTKFQILTKNSQFVKPATAERHRGLNTLYIKHNFFHQNKLGGDVKLKKHIYFSSNHREMFHKSIH